MLYLGYQESGKPRRKGAMSVLVYFDDDEVRQYNGETKRECIKQAEARCKKTDTEIIRIVGCEQHEELPW